MTLIAAPSSGWDDWLKWMPGWLAFAWALGNGIYLGIRRVFDRRARLALGAAPDDVREALITARTRFEDIVTEGRRANWFTAEERRETARAIRDLMGRGTDQTLREHLTRVVDAWDEAFALAPGAAGPMAQWGLQPISPQEREESARVQTQFGKEADVSRTALEDIASALTRLDELEQRTHGR
ncbi:hypothetical protein [Streptomyces sp. NPDC051665]|uniref:hypothetical protein n=1 Tax=Streptomyces sp. NPDC051665 TaxID=3154647 RepID=UPI0034397524